MKINVASLSNPSIDHFREALLAAVARSVHSNSKISRMAGVHRVQCHRICRGQFKRISANVLKVAGVLGVLDDTTGRSQPRDIHWGRIEEKIRGVWDGTPLGAERLIAALDMFSVQSGQAYGRHRLRMAG